MGLVMIGTFSAFFCANSVFILLYTLRQAILALAKKYKAAKRGALRTEVKRIVYHIQIKMDKDEDFKQSSQSLFSNPREDISSI